MGKWESRVENVSACPPKSPGAMPLAGTSCSYVGDRYNTGICNFISGTVADHVYMVCVDDGSPTPPDPTPTTKGKIKYNGTNVPEYASSGGKIPGITGSESVEKNFFLHQLYEWQSDKDYRIFRNDLENMFSYFPLGNIRISANVMNRSGSSGSLTFPISG